MNILLNGEELEIEDGSTLAEMIAGLKLGRVRVAVERNFEIVPRDQHDSTILADGDRLEVVTFVGGG